MVGLRCLRKLNLGCCKTILSLLLMVHGFLLGILMLYFVLLKILVLDRLTLNRWRIFAMLWNSVN